jgi:V-type H+-transporting ATPase subunit a
VYPFGVDPIWFASKNELNYVNSLKMKLSVIFGVLQMSLGVFMKALNTLYFKQYLEFTFEFIP